MRFGDGLKKVGGIQGGHLTAEDTSIPQASSPQATTCQRESVKPTLGSKEFLKGQYKWQGAIEPDGHPIPFGPKN